MKIRTADLNACILFGVIPWVLVSGFGVAAYGLLIAILLVNRMFTTILSIGGLILLAYGLVHLSPQLQFLSHDQLTNSYNTYFAWMLVLAGPFASSRIAVRSNRLTDMSLWLFTIFAIAQRFDQTHHNAIFQIACYSVALYFLFADTLDRKLFTFAFVLLSGARTIAAGFFVAVFLNRADRIRAALSTPALAVLIIVILSGSAAAVGYDFLDGLKEQHIFLKGRTSFWLALLEINPGLVGQGAGEALLRVEAVLGRFQLPHNDWLRLYTDFGLLGLLTTLIAMYGTYRKSDISRFATIILAFYMLTGNPLSFPTVIASYFIACRTYREPIFQYENQMERRVETGLHGQRV